MAKQNKKEKKDPEAERKSLETILKLTEGAVYATHQRNMFYKHGGDLARGKTAAAAELYARENPTYLANSYAHQGIAQLSGEKGEDFWDATKNHAGAHLNALSDFSVKEILEMIISKSKYDKAKIEEVAPELKKVYGKTLKELLEAKEAGDKNAEKDANAIMDLYQMAVGIKYDMKVGQMQMEQYLYQIYRAPEQEQQAKQYKKAA